MRRNFYRAFEDRWRGDREDGRAAPSGIYFCVLVADRFRKVMKLVLVR